MNINATINAQANETLTKTASEIALAFLVAAGGDETLDTSTVTITANAGTSPFPGPVGPDAPPPPEPRTIG